MTTREVTCGECRGSGRCSTCKGQGCEDCDDKGRCPRCDGRGYIEIYD